MARMGIQGIPKESPQLESIKWHHQEKIQRGAAMENNILNNGRQLSCGHMATFLKDFPDC